MRGRMQHAGSHAESRADRMRSFLKFQLACTPTLGAHGMHTSVPTRPWCHLWTCSSRSSATHRRICGLGCHRRSDPPARLSVTQADCKLRIANLKNHMLKLVSLLFVWGSCDLSMHTAVVLSMHTPTCFLVLSLHIGICVDYICYIT
jgi:hypothetical protein